MERFYESMIKYIIEDVKKINEIIKNEEDEVMLKEIIIGLKQALKDYGVKVVFDNPNILKSYITFNTIMHTFIQKDLSHGCGAQSDAESGTKT